MQGILAQSRPKIMIQGSVQSDCNARFWRHLTCLAVCVLALGVLAVPMLAAQGSSKPATLTYKKVMKGSVPEYTSVTVDTTGAGTYQGRQLDESPRPRALKLTPATTKRLFALAASLNNFHSIKLESKLKVANMGQKTLIYRKDGQENKVEFNYTRNKTANDLLTLFDGIADVEQHITRLEYSSRYDVLGLPSDLTQVEIDLDNKVLVDPQLMVPILTKIAGDSQYLHIAQIRAEYILRRIKGSHDSQKNHRHLF